MEKFSVSKLQREIKKMAASLPVQFSHGIQNVLITGTDVHLSGLDTEGIENDETEYLIKMDVYILLNHKRLLQKAYKKEGMIGIVRYVNACYENPIIDGNIGKKKHLDHVKKTEVQF